MVQVFKMGAKFGAKFLERVLKRQYGNFSVKSSTSRQKDSMIRRSRSEKKLYFAYRHKNCKMVPYMNSEKTKMLLTYGAAKCNVAATEKS